MFLIIIIAKETFRSVPHLTVHQLAESTKERLAFSERRERRDGSRRCTGRRGHAGRRDGRHETAERLRPDQPVRRHCPEPHAPGAVGAAGGENAPVHEQPAASRGAPRDRPGSAGDGLSAPSRDLS